MQLKTLHTVALLAATLTTGLMAGLFAAFGYAVMPGLAGSSDRTFVEAMQKINASILNGWFMFCFLGGIAFTALALALSLRSGADRAALPWIIAGLVLYLAMLVITSGVNVPLNDQLAKAGDPARIADLAAARRDFEARWVTWNTVRAVANIAAFAVLAWALILHGRATASPAASAEPGAGASVTTSASAPAAASVSATAVAAANTSGPGAGSYGTGTVAYGPGADSYGQGTGSYGSGSGSVAYGTGTGRVSAPS
ncbi:anthrone oxygenase family protein [Streptomyces buecherae]|uniref:anthrone oxygenase family protein n=1 Tax=Streptomyces buecherae TaxID=2763006 RepID=UPI001C253C2B|nr:anthrone oxygenase family protein [Streptomyces buecherae]